MLNYNMRKEIYNLKYNKNMFLRSIAKKLEISKTTVLNHLKEIEKGLKEIKSISDPIIRDQKTIVELYENGKSVTEISKEYQLKDKTIYAWIRDFSTVKAGTKPVEFVSLKEHQKLQKELKDAKLDLEILKKSIAIFSKK